MPNTKFFPTGPTTTEPLVVLDSERQGTWPAIAMSAAIG